MIHDSDAFRLLMSMNGDAVNTRRMAVHSCDARCANLYTLYALRLVGEAPCGAAVLLALWVTLLASFWLV